MRRSTIYLLVLGFTVVMTAALMSEGLIVSAQNTNSSTTMTNTNESKPKPKPRRGTSRAKKPAATEGAATETEAMPQATPAPRKTGRCDPSQQEQADLSGTYTGKVKHGDQPPADATLTITGNNFTMTSGTDTHSGRITAVTTCGYTAVTMMMGDLTPPAAGQKPPAAMPAMSLRAKKVGDSLTLTSVPGEPQMISFTTAGAAKTPRRHRAKKTGAPPTPPPTPPPATPPATPPQ